MFWTVIIAVVSAIPTTGLQYLFQRSRPPLLKTTHIPSLVQSEIKRLGTRVQAYSMTDLEWDEELDEAELQRKLTRQSCMSIKRKKKSKVASRRHLWEQKHLTELEVC